VGEIGRTIRELSTVYAFAARISWAVLESDGVAGCCIDSALKSRRSATAHSSSCSRRIAPTSRMTAAGFGKMPTTFERRVISLLSRFSGFVLCSCR